MTYILTLDQGTTSSRAILYSEMLKPIAISQKPIALATPKADYVEQNASELWYTQLFCARDVLNTANVTAKELHGIAITNQRETCVFWDSTTGEPLAPAIVWQDRRTKNICTALTYDEPQLVQDIGALTGLRLDPYFSATKIRWAIRHYDKVANAYALGKLMVGTVDSWLLFKLTGNHTTDITNASRTLLFDIHKGQWSKQLLNAFDISCDILPTVLPCDGDFGVTKNGLFDCNIPILAVMGDQQAALFGQDCLEVGQAKNTYGTGCFLLMNTGADKPTTHTDNAIISTIAWQQNTAPITYALEGSVFMGGAIVQWLRDNLGIITHSQDIEPLANSVNDTNGVVLIPAFTGLGAPHWRSDITASITGMTRGTTKAHIAKAALHAIAYQSLDVLDAMSKQSRQHLTELRVDGGAATNDSLMQFQADILNVPVLRAADTESTAKGVTLMALDKLGIKKTDAWQSDKVFYPAISEDERGEKIHLWRKRLTLVLSNDH